MAIELGAAYISILPSTDKLAPAIRKELGKIEDDASREGGRSGSSFASSFRAKMGSALKGGLIAGAASVGGLGILGVKTAAELEQAEIAFTTMLGSGEKAKAFIADLNEFAKKTPFDFPGLQTAASSLISAGVETKKVLPIMRTLGDVTSGMGTGSEGIKRATIALQQMNAAGRITGEDLNQLRDAGIPVYDLLSKATGKSKAEVVALAQAGKLGKVELDQMMKALATGKGLEKFSGLMEKQSASLTGMWSTFTDTLAMGTADAVKPLIPLLKDGLTAATTALGPALTTVSTGLRDGLLWAKAFAAEWRANTGAGGQARAVFSTVASVLGTLLGIGVAVVKWANDNRQVVVALAAAFVALRLTVLAYNAAQKVAAAGGLAKYLLGVARSTRIAQAATKAYTATKWLLTGALKAARVALTATAKAARLVGTALLTAVRAAASFLASVVLTTARVVAQTAAYVAQRVVILAISAATKAWAVAQFLLNTAMALNPIGLVVLAIVALVAVFVIAWKKSDKFRAVIMGAFDAVKNAAMRAIGWIKANWQKILAILTGPFGIAVLLIAKNWDKIKSGAKGVLGFVKEKFNAIVTFVKGLPARISTAASGLFNGIKDAFKDALNWIIGKWNGLSFTLPSIDTKIPGVGKVGGFTLNTPDITPLAKGGVLNRPTFVAGEAGAEVVAPLSDLHRMLDTAASIGASNAEARRYEGAASGTSGGSGRVEFVITNWKTGEGFFREIAEDTYHGEDEFAGTTRRMR